jgi:phage terminase large subunit GpA-like protein
LYGFLRRFSPTFGATELKNATTPGPGYCHFPIAYQQEFFNQLTSEEVRTRFVRCYPLRYWFKPSGKRNEALDRRVYALVALHARPVPWEGGPPPLRSHRAAAATDISPVGR